MADDTAQPGWMSDVQRALAIILVATFSVALLVMVVRVTFWGDIPTISDILKIMVPALINVVTFVLGYFYGSSKAKDTSDTSQQKIVDKLTSNNVTPITSVNPRVTMAGMPWQAQILKPKTLKGGFLSIIFHRARTPISRLSPRWPL